MILQVIVGVTIWFLFGAVMTACLLDDWGVSRPLRITGAILWPLFFLGLILYGSIKIIFGK